MGFGDFDGLVDVLNNGIGGCVAVECHCAFDADGFHKVSQDLIVCIWGIRLGKTVQVWNVLLAFSQVEIHSHIE